MSLPKARRGMEWANGKHDGGSNEAKDDPPSAQTNGRGGEIIPATKPYLH